MSCERVKIPGGGVAVLCGGRPRHGRRPHHSSCPCPECERRRKLKRERARAAIQGRRFERGQLALPLPMVKPRSW